MIRFAVALALLCASTTAFATCGSGPPPAFVWFDLHDTNVPAPEECGEEPPPRPFGDEGPRANQGPRDPHGDGADSDSDGEDRGGRN